MKALLIKCCFALALVMIYSASYSQTVTAAEYFFDTDPGPGLGTSISVTAGATIDISSLDIPTTSLTSGWHKICVRTKDGNNTWSFYECRSIYLRDPAIPIIPPAAANITAAEFFIDNVGDAGTGTTIPVTPSTTVNITSTSLANSAAVGWHTLYVRAKDQNNAWGFYEARTLYLRGPAPVIPPPSPIVSFEYFVDTDPGVGLSPTTLTPTPSTTIDLTDQMLNVGGLTLGTHNLGVRAKNQNGDWSTTELRSFTVQQSCPGITPPTVPAFNSCVAAAASLTASGATGPQVYRWFDDNTTTTVLYTGATYTTPVLSATRHYFVSIYDPVALCESPRTDVAVNITIIPKPALSISGSLSVCEGTTQDISAPPGFTSYTWSDGRTTSMITATATGSYSVIVKSGSCSSPSSDPFVFTVNPKPTKPTISPTGGGSLCGTGTVTLTSSAASSYSWSSGQSSQSITVNTVGNFSVQVKNAAGCQSAPSDIFTVTTSAIPKPIIAVTGNTTLCNGSTVDLAAPDGFTGYTWSDGITSKTRTVSTAGNYSVIVSNGTCVSPSSDNVPVTSVAIPSQPVILPSGATALCNGAFVVLTAPAGFSNYLWSDGEVGKQRVVSAAGNYSVQVGNASNCLSISSDLVEVSLTGLDCTGGGATLPPPPNADNANSCGPGSVTLTASGAPAGMEYRWYDVSTGGISISSQSTFTTGVLSQSADFYVAVFDPAISIEGNRTKVTATVFDIPGKPAITAVGKEFICSGSIVALTAQLGFTNYKWSNGKTTQTILVEEEGDFTVQTGMSPTCLSVASDVFQVKIGTTAQCGVVVSSNNRAPEIVASEFAVPIQSTASYPLAGLISDENDNLDLSTLRITDQPKSGASVSIDADFNLKIDYTGINFSGKESITLQVCDTDAACSQQQMTIDVVGEVVVYNGVTPDGDGFNDFMLIRYVDIIEDAKNNKVTIFNRWGNAVFEISNYNNTDRVFEGKTTGGSELPSGIYLYKVEITSGKTFTGYLTLKR
ncbi:MAG: gliding motility-associated C-terminal domain-containing protein [Bacteroidota bacterium]